MFEHGRLMRLGTWKLTHPHPIDLRFRQLLSHLREMLGELERWRDASEIVVAYEEVNFTRGLAATMSSYGLRATIMIAAGERGIDYQDFTVGDVKFAATGKKNAKKPAIVAAMRAKFGLGHINDDEADALAIGIVAHERAGIKLQTG